jgi:hypothetical protein
MSVRSSSVSAKAAEQTAHVCLMISLKSLIPDLSTLLSVDPNVEEDMVDEGRDTSEAQCAVDGLDEGLCLLYGDATPDLECRPHGG